MDKKHLGNILNALAAILSWIAAALCAQSCISHFSY